ADRARTATRAGRQESQTYPPLQLVRSNQPEPAIVQFSSSGTYKLSNRLGIEWVAAETINGVRGIGHNAPIDYQGRGFGERLWSESYDSLHFVILTSFEVYILFKFRQPRPPLPTPTVVVHGGAGKWPKARQPRGLKGVRRAAVIGADTIHHGGSAVDAVEAAVVSMEDDPVFNAGTGSTLNLLGEVEMDAAIVDGTSFQTGG